MFAVIIAAVIIQTVFSVIGSLSYSGCPGCEISTVNSNAKLVFTNAAAYTTKCEYKNKYLPDGIYFGEISKADTLVYETAADKNGETYERLVSAVDYNGTYDDFAVFMNEIMSCSSKKYYAVIFSDGVPNMTYFSHDKKLSKYYSKMELSYRKGTLAEDYCSMEDFGGIYVGCYPNVIVKTREIAEQLREDEINHRKELDAQAEEFLKMLIPEYIKSRGELADGIYRGEFSWGINEGNEYYPKEMEATDLEDYFYTVFKKEEGDRPSGAFIFEIKNGEPVFAYWNQYGITEWINHVTDEELREAYKNGERAIENWGYAAK